MSTVAAAAPRRKQARVAKKAGAVEFQLLLFVALGLVAFGLVMVYSATSAPAALAATDPASALKRQGMYAVVGLVALGVMARFDYRRLRPLAPTLLVVSLALCAFVAAAAPRVNGARRWLTFGPLTFQPSELAKVSLAVWVSAYLARRPAPRTLKELMRPIGAVFLVFAVLLLLEPDLGTTITVAIMLCGILFVSAVPLRTLGLAVAITSAVGFAAVWMRPFQRARLLTFLDPWADPSNAGLQVTQALIGLGSGGLFGRGLGQGIEKIHYLPEANTDMIFAVIGEELGLVGVTLVVLAYGTFAYAGFRIALSARDPFGKRLAAGLTTLVCGQAAVNIAAVLSIAPLTGIPLPFISYGGTSLLLTLASVGVLLNIAVNGGKDGAAVPDRGGRDGGTRRPGARNRRSAAGTRR